MYGLTELQLINNIAPWACEYKKQKPRLAIAPVFQGIALAWCKHEIGDIQGIPMSEVMDQQLFPPITHGEWEARQKAGE